MAGAVSVDVSNPDGQLDTVANAYTYQAAPTVTNIAPTAGALGGGTPVTITGTGFLTAVATTVDFGGSACNNVVVGSATEITCTTTPHAAGVVAVTVTNPDTQTGTLANAYTYQAASTVTGIAPVSGPLAGGTNVTIAGTDFLGGAIVDIGGNACAAVVVVSPLQITCTTAARAAGVVAVTVTNPDTQTGTLNASFTYQAAPTVTGVTPIGGNPAGGTAVTITGTEFLAGATVDFGGSACNGVAVNLPTQITCTTTAHAIGSVDMEVTNPDGQTGTRVTSYTYRPPPTVTVISPDGGNPAGGTAVTITGTGFVAGATVDIGGSACNVVSVNTANQITCTTTARALGAADVTVANPDTQSGTFVNGFTYRNAPTVTSISPANGPLGGGMRVAIVGTGFLAGATVDIGGSACTNIVVVSPLQITCTTSARVAGAVDVAVGNSDGQSGQLAGGFTYRAQAFLQFVAATPDPDDYGIGNANITHTFTLENVGDVTTSTIAVFRGGTDPMTWNIASDNCSGAGNELASGASCTFQATFLGGFFATGNYDAIIFAQAANGGTVQNSVSGEVP